jgi:cytochrome P450
MFGCCDYNNNTVSKTSPTKQPTRWKIRTNNSLLEGPVFRYRPNAVLMNTPSAYKTIFGPKGNVVKTESYYRTWPHNSEITNTWNVTNVEAHARKRRVLNNAFSDRALRGMEPFLVKNSE